MITSFRIEAEGTTKANVQKKLTDAALSMQQHLISSGQGGKWRVTDDVISLKQEGGYKGRMKLVYLR